MNWSPIPKSFRWILRKGIFGFIRSLIKEFISYYKTDSSQFGEASFMSELLGKEVGVFVDIGSGRPISGSNTFHLYKRGWNGILVDPIPKNKFLSKVLRPKDKFFQGLIGQNTRHDFFYFEPYAYSTTSRKRAQEVLETKGDAVRLVSILDLPGHTMRELLLKFNVTEIDFLNIDVEGLELQVLQSNDWSMHLPKVICAEILDLEHTMLFDYLHGLGYKSIGFRGPSYFFQLGKAGGGGGI